MARPKGSKNKYQDTVKDMLRKALINKGGIKYFERQAEMNPVAFMSLIGKTIPAEVNATIEHMSFFDKYAKELALKDVTPVVEQITDATIGATIDGESSDIVLDKHD